MILWCTRMVNRKPNSEIRSCQKIFNILVIVSTFFARNTEINTYFVKINKTINKKACQSESAIGAYVNFRKH